MNPKISRSNHTERYYHPPLQCPEEVLPFEVLVKIVSLAGNRLQTCRVSTIWYSASLEKTKTEVAQIFRCTKIEHLAEKAKASSSFNELYKIQAELKAAELERISETFPKFSSQFSIMQVCRHTNMSPLSDKNKLAKELSRVFKRSANAKLKPLISQFIKLYPVSDKTLEFIILEVKSIDHRFATEIATLIRNRGQKNLVPRSFLE